MFDSLIRKFNAKSSTKPIDERNCSSRATSSLNVKQVMQTDNYVMLEMSDLSNKQFVKIVNPLNSNSMCTNNFKIVYINNPAEEANQNMLNNCIYHQHQQLQPAKLSGEEHIYEEIQDLNNNKQKQLIADNDDQQCFNRSAKKSVRFTQHHHPNQLLILNPNNLLKSNSSHSFNSILKNKSVQVNATAHNYHFVSNSVNSNSSTLSSNSSASSANSHCSNQHSVMFNQMVEDFLNKLNTSQTNNYSLKQQQQKLHRSLTNSESMKQKAKKKNPTNVQTSNNFDKLSFRVTNLTLDDLKIRQMNLVKLSNSKKSLQQQSSFNSYDSTIHNCNSLDSSVSIASSASSSNSNYLRNNSIEI